MPATLPRAGRRAITVYALATIGLLSGCSLVQSGGQPTLSGIAACATGTSWNLDTAALASQIKADLVKQGLPDATSTVTVDGSQTMTWNTDGTVEMTTDYVVKVTATPAADNVTVVTSSHSGRSTGVAFISAEVAIPRKWDNTGLAIETAATLNGAVLEAVPIALPVTDLDDAVGIEITCSNNALTTHPRGKTITQTWARG